MDEDVLSSDEVGHSNIKLNSLYDNGGFNRWFEIYHEGKLAGKIYLRGEWKPDIHCPTPPLKFN